MSKHRNLCSVIGYVGSLIIHCENVACEPGNLTTLVGDSKKLKISKKFPHISDIRIKRQKRALLATPLISTNKPGTT